MTSDPDGSNVTGFRGTGNLTVAAMYLDAAIKREHTAHYGQPPTLENGKREKILGAATRAKGIHVRYERRAVDGAAHEILLHKLIVKRADATPDLSPPLTGQGCTSFNNQPRLDCHQNELYFKQLIYLGGAVDKSSHLPIVCHPTRAPS
jgi:hypothetical protein